MINLMLMLLEIVTCYIVLTLIYRKYEKEGIYLYAIIATILASIMCLKHIAIMEINIPLGLGVTTSIIIGGNILTQKYGKEAIKNYLLLIFISSIFVNGFLNMSTMLINSKYVLESNEAYNIIFNYNLGIEIALLVSLLIAVFVSSNLYYLLKRIQNKIIISNIFSILIVEFIENIVYVFIAYLLEFSTIEIALCIVFRYIVKVIMGIIGTIPIIIVSKYSDKE